MASKTKEKIAVIHPNPNFLEAITAAFGILFEGFEFITVDENKVRNLTSDCDKIATLNTYAFPTSRKLTNYVFGLKYIADDKDGSLNKAQRETFWNPDTTPVTIAKMLQTPTEMTLIPESATNAATNAALKADLAFMQAPSDKEHQKADNPDLAIANAQIAALQQKIDAISKVSAI